MKSTRPPASFLVPRALGRSETDMVARGYGEQLELFREVLTRQAKVQIIAMMGLSDPKHLDRTQYAKVADILRAMGYEPVTRADGKIRFPTWLYETVESTGLKLRRNAFPIIIREPAGFTKDRRRKTKVSLVDLSILQDFGFYYEDEEGQPIDLDEIPKDKLIKYEPINGKALYAIPMTDDHGNVITNKDGSPRRRLANGVQWTFSSKIARLAADRQTSWVFYRDAVAILRRFLSKPASFDLIFKTLFWNGSGMIEMSRAKLVEHLGIKAKDRRRVDAAIANAFADALKEGIIDKPVTIRPPGYYQPTPKNKRPRRVNEVYQWKRAANWQPAGNLITLTEDNLGADVEDKTESMKDGKAAQPRAPGERHVVLSSPPIIRD
jgi:hypothetical protein